MAALGCVTTRVIQVEDVLAENEQYGGRGSRGWQGRQGLSAAGEPTRQGAR